MAINDDLANAVLRNSHRTVQFEKTINRQIQGNLVQLERELARILADGDLAGALTRFQERRLTRLRKDVNEAINTTYAANTKSLQLGLFPIAQQTQRLTIESFNRVIGVDIFNVTLVPAELRALASNPVVLGGTVTENWVKQNRSLTQAFTEQMRLGLAQGETNDQLVNRIIGKPTGAKQSVIVDGKTKSVPQRAGGVMDVSKRQATALVRTSAQSVSNTTLQSIYNDNDDVIAGVATLVTLDGRTTLICMSLSGGQWSLKTGDPLPDSETQDPYPGPPPYHWNALAGDTMVETQQGLRRIDSIEPGEMVMTGKGRFRPCYAVHRKFHKGRILEVGFDSGAKLMITDDHPIAVVGRGWQAVDDLEVGDECFEYSEGSEPSEHRPTPCGVADCSPALLVEELVSDEVHCLPLFRNFSVDLEHHASGEGEVDDVAVLAELEQVLAVPEMLKDADEVAFASRRARGEVSSAFQHGCVDGGAVAHGVAGTHSLRDLGEARVGVLGEAVRPDLGRVVLSGGVRQRGSLALASGGDAELAASAGDCVVRKSEIPFDGAQRFAAVDVAALDELLEKVTVVPGAAFRHTSCTSIVERAWQGEVFNLSVVGDETYVANGVLVHNCRTVISPITKSWEELGAGKKSKILDEAKSPDRVRASMNGEAPGRQQYSGFLRGESKKFQNSVLGKTRADLFRAGKLELNQLTDASLKVLSLDELMKVIG